MDERRVKQFFSGLNFIVVGLILLANTTGVLPWSVWWSVLALWPLLLVAAGIDVIGRTTHSTALRVVASLLVLAGLAYGALVLPGAPVRGTLFGGSAPKPYSLSEAARGDVRSGNVTVKAGLSKLTVRAGDKLATVDGVTPFGTPSLDVSREGTAASLRIALTGNRGPSISSDLRSEMNVTLDRGLVWDSMDVEAGLSDSDIDLSGLDVRHSRLGVGLSNSRISFGSIAKDADASIDGGLASLTIRVPKDLGVELDASTGLGSLRVPDGWQRTSGPGNQSSWRSDGYDQSASKLRLRISAGLSTVAIERS